jgi:hypothetical protein
MSFRRWVPPSPSGGFVYNTHGDQLRFFPVRKKAQSMAVMGIEIRKSFFLGLLADESGEQQDGHINKEKKQSQ